MLCTDSRSNSVDGIGSRRRRRTDCSTVREPFRAGRRRRRRASSTAALCAMPNSQERKRSESPRTVWMFRKARTNTSLARPSGSLTRRARRYPTTLLAKARKSSSSARGSPVRARSNCRVEAIGRLAHKVLSAQLRNSSAAFRPTWSDISGISGSCEPVPESRRHRTYYAGMRSIPRRGWIGCGRAGPGRVRRAKRAEGGFTIVELVVSMALLSIVAAPLASVFWSAIRTAGVAAHRTDGSSIASREIEGMRSVPYSLVGFYDDQGLGVVVRGADHRVARQRRRRRPGRSFRRSQPKTPEPERGGRLRARSRPGQRVSDRSRRGAATRCSGTSSGRARRTLRRPTTRRTSA